MRGRIVKPGQARRSPRLRRLSQVVGLPPSQNEQSPVIEEPAQAPKTARKPKAASQDQHCPAPRAQKRQIGNGGDDGDYVGNEHPAKRARLTRKNLAKLDKMVKRKGAKAPGPAALQSTADSTTTKTTSTTSSGFAIQAYKNGILHPSESKLPTNHEEIHKRYAEPRGTASPTESSYKQYVRKVAKAGNEATVAFAVGPRLLKDYDDDYERAINRGFTRFPKNVGFNNGLSAPQPDFVEGPHLQTYKPFPVDEQIDGAVLYKDDPFSITLPHLAGEWKGPEGNMKEATLQSAYGGAALVHARNQALAYLGKSDPPGHAEVMTFTTDGTTLNVYAHYTAMDEDTLEYHQHLVKSANLVDSHQGHKEGRRALRNIQDHAKRQSHALRDQLKEHWKQHRDGIPPIAETPALPEETNPDEDEAGFEVIEQPCPPLPATLAAPSSVSSSKSLTTPDGSAPGSRSQKRKASPPLTSRESRSRSKGKSYWERDARSGQYFHKHFDGQVTWAKD